MVSNASYVLAGLESVEDFNTHAESLLIALGELYEADRCYIFQIFHDSNRVLLLISLKNRNGALTGILGLDYTQNKKDWQH